MVTSAGKQVSEVRQTWPALPALPIIYVDDMLEDTARWELVRCQRNEGSGNMKNRRKRNDIASGARSVSRKAKPDSVSSAILRWPQAILAR